MSTTAVLFGGPSDEHDISVLTGLQVCRALDGDVTALYWSKGGDWFNVDPRSEGSDFVEGIPRKARPATLTVGPEGGFAVKRKAVDVDVAFVACHGGPGEDGTLQGILDLIGIRYTGPGQAASALGMDKFAFGSTMSAAGLPSLPRVLVPPGSGADRPGFDGPYIVKPRFGGSSIGIEVADDWDTVLALTRSSSFYASGGVVEPFLAGSRDLQVAVRTHPAPEQSAIEAPARTESGIYSYDQKYLAWGGEVSGGREVPADLDDTVETRLRELADAVATIYGIRGISRIDFLEHDGDLWINEINTIPGSMAVYLWVDPPRDRRELFADMVAEAAATPARTFSTAGSDGTALRNAGSIAAKLG